MFADRISCWLVVRSIGSGKIAAHIAGIRAA
jgi:hypothetical protein